MYDLKYGARISEAESAIISKVLPALVEAQATQPGIIFSAVREMLDALEQGHFNRHHPKDAAAWEYVAQPVRVEVEFDDERLYLLSSVLRHCMVALGNALDFKYCARMLEVRLLQ